MSPCILSRFAVVRTPLRIWLPMYQLFARVSGASQMAWLLVYCEVLVPKKVPSVRISDAGHRLIVLLRKLLHFNMSGATKSTLRRLTTTNTSLQSNNATLALKCIVRLLTTSLLQSCKLPSDSTYKNESSVYQSANSSEGVR